MPTAACIETLVVGVDAPQLDAASCESANDLLLRLRRSNHALDRLRSALERDETPFPSSGSAGRTAF